MGFIGGTIDQNVTNGMEKVKFDLQEIQSRMDRNPIPNPETVRIETARLEIIAAAEYAQQKGNETLIALKELFA